MGKKNKDKKGKKKGAGAGAEMDIERGNQENQEVDMVDMVFGNDNAMVDFVEGTPGNDLASFISAIFGPEALSEVVKPFADVPISQINHALLPLDSPDQDCATKAFYYADADSAWVSGGPCANKPATRLWRTLHIERIVHSIAMIKLGRLGSFDRDHDHDAPWKDDDDDDDDDDDTGARKKGGRATRSSTGIVMGGLVQMDKLLGYSKKDTGIGRAIAQLVQQLIDKGFIKGASDGMMYELVPRSGVSAMAIQCLIMGVAYTKCVLELPMPNPDASLTKAITPKDGDRNEYIRKALGKSIGNIKTEYPQHIDIINDMAERMLGMKGYNVDTLLPIITALLMDALQPPPGQAARVNIQRVFLGGPLLFHHISRAIGGTVAETKIDANAYLAMLCAYTVWIAAAYPPPEPGNAQQFYSLSSAGYDLVLRIASAVHKASQSIDVLLKEISERSSLTRPEGIDVTGKFWNVQSGSWNTWKQLRYIVDKAALSLDPGQLCSSGSPPTLFPHQHVAYTGLLSPPASKGNLHNWAGLLLMHTTGSGKTCSAKALYDFSEFALSQPDPTVTMVVMVPTKSLATQWERDWGSNLRCPVTSISRPAVEKLIMTYGRARTQLIGGAQGKSSEDSARHEEGGVWSTTASMADEFATEGLIDMGRGSRPERFSKPGVRNNTTRRAAKSRVLIIDECHNIVGFSKLVVSNEALAAKSICQHVLRCRREEGRVVFAARRQKWLAGGSSSEVSVHQKIAGENVLLYPKAFTRVLLLSATPFKLASNSWEQLAQSMLYLQMLGNPSIISPFFLWGALMQACLALHYTDFLLASSAVIVTGDSISGTSTSAAALTLAQTQLNNAHRLIKIMYAKSEPVYAFYSQAKAVAKAAAAAAAAVAAASSSSSSEPPATPEEAERIIAALQADNIDIIMDPDVTEALPEFWNNVVSSDKLWTFSDVLVKKAGDRGAIADLAWEMVAMQWSMRYRDSLVKDTTHAELALPVSHFDARNMNAVFPALFKKNNSNVAGLQIPCPMHAEEVSAYLMKLSSDLDSTSRGFVAGIGSDSGYSKSDTVKSLIQAGTDSAFFGSQAVLAGTSSRFVLSQAAIRRLDSFQVLNAIPDRSHDGTAGNLLRLTDINIGDKQVPSKYQVLQNALLAKVWDPAAKDPDSHFFGVSLVYMNASAAEVKRLAQLLETANRQRVDASYEAMTGRFDSIMDDATLQSELLGSGTREEQVKLANATRKNKLVDVTEAMARQFVGGGSDGDNQKSAGVRRNAANKALKRANSILQDIHRSKFNHLFDDDFENPHAMQEDATKDEEDEAFEKEMRKLETVEDLERQQREDLHAFFGLDPRDDYRRVIRWSQFSSNSSTDISSLVAGLIGHKRNRDGKYISAIILGMNEMDGMHFRNIKSVHILSPPASSEELRQIEGRGLSMCSLLGNEKLSGAMGPVSTLKSQRDSVRQVYIFTYVAQFPRPGGTFKLKMLTDVTARGILGNQNQDDRPNRMLAESLNEHLRNFFVTHLEMETRKARNRLQRQTNARSMIQSDDAEIESLLDLDYELDMNDPFQGTLQMDDPVLEAREIERMEDGPEKLQRRLKYRSKVRRSAPLAVAKNALATRIPLFDLAKKRIFVKVVYSAEEANKLMQMHPLPLRLFFSLDELLLSVLASSGSMEDHIPGVWKGMAVDRKVWREAPANEDIDVSGKDTKKLRGALQLRLDYRYPDNKDGPRSINLANQKDEKSLVISEKMRNVVLGPLSGKGELMNAVFGFTMRDPNPNKTQQATFIDKMEIENRGKRRQTEQGRRSR